MTNAVTTIENITTDMIIEAASEYGISDKLINAVIEQLGSDDSDLYYKLESVAGHGADIGIGGFIYHNECYEFWNKNRREIRTLLSNMADQLGEDVLGMIKGFNCLRDGDYSIDDIGEAIYSSDHNDDYTSIYDALAWFALEEVARAAIDNIEIEK